MIHDWATKDTVSVVIGIITSILTAVAYEVATSHRKKTRDRRTFSFLESNHQHVWQHYNINSGKITVPIESYMHLRYLEEKRLKVTWYGTDRVLLGEGFITWQDGIHGQLSAYEYSTSSYRYRNVFYREIEHNGNTMDAIFVNADDEGTKYVMLRNVAQRPNT